MSKILIVGSGASGTHFALSLLKKGHEVLMLDVGNAGEPTLNPSDSFNALKDNLNDPVQYFLGRNYEAVIYRDSKGEYYGFPPTKNYVFSKPSFFKSEATGFAPLFSFAQGGLAETWTGGVYPLNDQELKQLPFRYSEIEPGYNEVSRRIGISGTIDDLAKFYPVHSDLMEPLRLDHHSQRLLDAYEENRRYLNKDLGCYVGRSRIATLSGDQGERKECTYKGRCLWGCPSESLYVPSITLSECKKHPDFTYMPNIYASHFTFRSNSKIQSLVARSLPGNRTQEFEADTFALAAGTLSSSKIFLDSIWKSTGEIVKLTGLMDNRQILIPFLNMSMIGKKYDPENYQYHQLAIGIEFENSNYYHGLITTLKTALVHPILQRVHLDLRTSLFLFRNIRAGLGVLNLNFPDERRDSNFVTLRTDETSEQTRLVIHYSPSAEEPVLRKKVIRIVKKALWKLGCVVPPGLIYTRPMGASVHYAGTIPMSTTKTPLTSSEYCQSHDFDNLYFVDGSTFPSLPAKNLTFTLMANAIRVAEKRF